MSKQSQALYRAAQVRELDRLTIEEHSVPGIVLMKRAGRVAFDILLQRWPDLQQITVFCGAGNNAGDGYIVAGLAQERNIDVRVVQLPPGDNLNGDARTAWQFANDRNVSMLPLGQFVADHGLVSGVIVDALFGTGLTREVAGDYARAIGIINGSGLPVLAVDVPSGLHSDTGAELGIAVQASVTVSFIGRKVGLTTARGPALAGECVFDDLDVPADIYTNEPPVAELLNLENLLSGVVPRDRDAHKGLFGHLMVVGGEVGFGGAALMAAEAAARVGAGLVSVATRPEHAAAFLARCPELMVKGVPSGQELEPLLEAPTVIVVGPGLGRSPWSEQMLQQVLMANKPTVFDADALNLLSEGRIGGVDVLTSEQRVSVPSVLTPHPGEAARLLGTTNSDIQADRLRACREIQIRYKATVLLKGAGTVITGGAHGDITLQNKSLQNNPLQICPYGNPGMASGGMGDVLSGVIGGLLAQGFDTDFAAQLGACLHGRAADKAVEYVGERGLLATDLLPHIRTLINGRT